MSSRTRSGSLSTTRRLDPALTPILCRRTPLISKDRKRFIVHRCPPSRSKLYWRVWSCRNLCVANIAKQFDDIGSGSKRIQGHFGDQ
jgi:hypothetical protein